MTGNRISYAILTASERTGSQPNLDGILNVIFLETSLKFPQFLVDPLASRQRRSSRDCQRVGAILVLFRKQRRLQIARVERIDFD